MTLPPRPLSLSMTVAAVVLAVGPLSAAGEPTGEQIYTDQCARCHGKAGEGSKRYDRPLTGILSLNRLKAYIHETMPEEDPAKCEGDDAGRVAEYIYEAFYSPAAQARNKPARVELARLTNDQYRNAVADLVGSFRGGGSFDLPNLGPNAEPVRYSERNWTGALFAPDTGEYEITLTAPPDVRGRVWLNDFSGPLVDAWVRSGPDTEFTGRVFLLGGRAYRLKIEAVKVVKKGEDTKKAPPPEVKLSWVPPHGVREPVPDRYLLKASLPEVYVPTTPLPPDDRSLGWVRGSSVSKEWDAAITDAAITAAEYVAGRLPELARVKANDPKWADKVRDFCRTFAERAFRRPLTDDLRAMYVDRQFDGTVNPETAAKRVVLLVLKSPRFLYREVTGADDQHDVAARLAFTLWDSVPDEPLRKAAAAGQLKTRDQVARQAGRMATDPRAHARLRAAVLSWLHLDHAGDVAKDPDRFPGFDAAAIADLRTSLDLTIADVLSSDAADLRKLLLADEFYLNGRLAKLYGVKLPADAAYTKVKLGKEPRAGVLTHPYVLSVFAYNKATSPIHRGVFLARGILGRNLKPPQCAFTPLAEDLHPGLTTRERTALQTKSVSCMVCHQTINNLGFTLESFDAVGRYRTNDAGKPVDTTGGYESVSGDVVTFAGPKALAEFVAASPDVHTAFAEHLFHQLVKQPVRAYGAGELDRLRDELRNSGYNIRKLMVEIAVTAAAPPTPPKPPA